MQITTIKIISLVIHPKHIEIIYAADEFKFMTKIFYHEIDLLQLAHKYTANTLQSLAAHIALFEGIKLCSLFPKYYDIGLIAPQLNNASLELFVSVYQGVFAQHWYENQVTDYLQPEFIYDKLLMQSTVSILDAQEIILTACGGGKDSVVAIKLLEQANLPFATMQYAHSCYGKADSQHKLISQVSDAVNAVYKHKISIFDDFMEFPLFSLYFPNNSGIVAAETPASIFISLPLMLAQGYTQLCLAHEKSANTGNLFWPAIGKEINHQWGKGFVAEKLINKYIRNNLIDNFNYFSILQPLHDIRILQHFSQYPQFIAKIHSCNVHKPWCKKCPKCAYVWLGLMAYADLEAVRAVFQQNLFDDPDLLPIFRSMLGLTAHTPFECIGEVAETRLLMKICLERGVTGKALDIFVSEILSDNSINWAAIEAKYARVYRDEHSIPTWIFNAIDEYL
jgi:UDP-N-acetyl-alpha-D-muramoyl-L-alanyl-L-glutamate epimerase